MSSPWKVRPEVAGWRETQFSVPFLIKCLSFFFFLSVVCYACGLEGDFTIRSPSTLFLWLSAFRAKLYASEASLGGRRGNKRRERGRQKVFTTGFAPMTRREFNEKPSPSPKCKITIITSCQVKAVSGQTSFNWASRRYRPILPFFIFPILFSPDSRTDSCKVNDIS